MPIKEFFVLMMVCVIWAMNFIVMKFTIQSDVPPIFYAAARMTLVLVLLLPFLKWHGGQMITIFLSGLGFGALNYLFLFPGVGMTTASAAAVTIELYMPFSILLGILFLSERIGLWRGFGMVMAFTGVVLIGLSKPSEVAGPYYHLGIFLVAAAAMSEAIGAVLVKKIKSIGPLQLLAWFAVIGSLILWPATFLIEDNQMRAFSPQSRGPFIGALLYSALLASILAHGSYYWLLQRLPIHMIAPSGLMMPVISVIASVLILKEPLEFGFVTGGFITLLGIALILWRNRVRGKAPLPDLAH